MNFLSSVPAAGCAVCCRGLFSGQVYSAKELGRMCGLSILGSLASQRSKNAPNKLDAALDRMEGRPDGTNDARVLCLIAESIRRRVPDAARILITGDLDTDRMEALAAALQATDALRGKTVSASGNILQPNSALQTILCADAIVLAADCTCSRYNAVTQQKEQLHRLGRDILGCIVFE